MRKVRLKFNVVYAMSGSPQANVVHIIDQDWSGVYVYADPADTKYKIRNICKQFGQKYKPKFFKKLPEGAPVCRACREGLEHRNELKRRGIMTQDGKMGNARELYAFAQGYPSRVYRPQSKRAPF